MRRGKVDIDAGRELAALYEEHSGPVFAYGLHLCGSRADAEDLVQIAFLQAHRALLRGERLVNPRAWLITVVKRQAFNRWRDRREVPSSGSMPETSLIDDDTAVDEIARVRLLLHSLPETQHQAFVLRHWSGLSNREIAGVLDTSESSVESLLVRARAAIVASGTGNEECFALRRQLTDDRDLTPAQSRHVARCKGCARAHQRLTRAAAAVVVLGLVPRAHVAQALASTVPGFAGTASAGAGAAGAGLAAKVTGTKTAIAAVGSLLAVAAAAPVALHVAHHLPMASHRASAAATIHRSLMQARPIAASAASAQGSGGAGGTHPAKRSPHQSRTDRHQARHQPGDAGDGHGDSASGNGGGSTSSDGVDSQGTSPTGATASDSQGQDTGGGGSSGSGEAASSQDGGSSGSGVDASSQDGGSSSVGG